MMKLAERATKQYDELERLTNNLRRAYDPPKQRRAERGKILIELILFKKMQIRV